MRKCTGKSKRSGRRCLKWAVRGKTTCHMHGGKSKGPTTKTGKENSRIAALKHGHYTKRSLKQNREYRELIRQSKEVLHTLNF